MHQLVGGADHLHHPARYVGMAPRDGEDRGELGSSVPDVQLRLQVVWDEQARTES
jgi:hypothetical protein